MAAIAAGVGVAGSVIGGVLGGKGAKKAANIQAAASDRQIAAAQQNRDYQYSLNAPTIARGEDAGSTIAALLGRGGDPAAAGAAFDAFKGSDGYQFRLDQGTKAVNTNASAGGLRDSGATLKALERYGQDYGSGEFGKYLGYLGGLDASGTNARGLVANVGTNAVNQFNTATQSAADAAGNAQIVSANGWADALKNIGQSASFALGSSYKTPTSRESPSAYYAPYNRASASPGYI